MTPREQMRAAALEAAARCAQAAEPVSAEAFTKRLAKEFEYYIEHGEFERP